MNTEGGTELAAPVDLADRLLAALGRKLRPPRWLWMLVATVLAGSLFLAFPAYHTLDRSVWEPVFETADRPLTDLGLGQGSHAARLMFRPTVPMLGGVLHLNVAGYLILQGIAGVALVAAFAAVAQRVLRDRVAVALLTAAFGLTYAGVVSFVETRGIFDGIALLLVVLSMMTRRPSLIAMFVFLAAWTDERALLASGFVLLLWLTEESNGDTDGARRLLNPKALAVVAGAVLYLGSRIAVTLINDLPSGLGSGDGFGRAVDQINNFPVGLWTGLEGLWLVAVLAAAALVLRRDWLALFLLLATTLAVVLFAISVVDITRSMAYLVPVALASLPVLSRAVSPERLRRLLLAAATLSLAWPVYYVGGKDTILWVYPLPMQIVGWATGQV